MGHWTALGEVDQPLAIKVDKMISQVEQAKARGYGLISYVSSKATTWPGFACGDNCFILEDNTIQPFATIGNDVVLWSGDPFSVYTKAVKVFIDGALVYDRSDPRYQPKSDFELVIL